MYFKKIDKFEAKAERDEQMCIKFLMLEADPSSGALDPVLFSQTVSFRPTAAFST